MTEAKSGHDAIDAVDVDKDTWTPPEVLVLTLRLHKRGAPRHMDTEVAFNVMKRQVMKRHAVTPEDRADKAVEYTERFIEGIRPRLQRWLKANL